MPRNSGTRSSELAHRYRAIGIGCLAALAGTGLLWASTQARTTSAQTFWSNIGTALITTGIVSIIYESVLQASLLEQVRLAAGQAEDTFRAGLTSVLVRSSELDLAKTFAGCQRIRIVPEDPWTWQARHYSSLLEAARSGCDIEIHLPTPEVYAQSLNGRSRVLGVEEARVGCSKIARSIVDAWVQSTSGTASPSVLRILQYPGAPFGGLIVADDNIVVSTGGMDGPEKGSEPFRAVFTARRGTPVRDWAEGLLEQLQSAVIEVSDPLGSVEEELSPREILPFAHESVFSGFEPPEGGPEK